jgi:hypothetical protein
MFFVVCVSILPLYVLSMGPVFGHYARFENGKCEDITKPVPRMILKMYWPLIRFFPDASSHCLEPYNVSMVEAYFMVNQEEFQPKSGSSSSHVP